MSRRRSAAALLVMCLAVVAVYLPIRNRPTDNTQEGGDFHYLHARRMDFAREHLARDKALPGWYPREFMGTPFWSNVQNFPFIPTRLAVLAVPKPYVYTAGVILSAVLAAAFTFGYGRAIGLGPVAAAAAGWTFACAGFYAGRVMQGVLPLLEGYPTLPLLLWLVEVNLPRPSNALPSTDAPPRRRWATAAALAGLALASTCTALAGHPQLPFYAFVTAGLYLLWRGWRHWGYVLRAGTAMALGVACAAFALWPMLLLVGRSTRVLPLAREPNDIPFPYERLGAMLLPWKDGWPERQLQTTGKAFIGGDPNAFFETVTYVSWLPLIAVVALVVRAVVLRKRPTAAGAFLLVAGVVAMVTALPAFHSGAGEVSRTLVRCPARQMYVTTFALAVALGMAVDLLPALAARLASARRVSPERLAAWSAAAVAIPLAAHAVDLTRHDRNFIRTGYLPVERPGPLQGQIRAAVGDGRIGIDMDLSAPFNRRIDDVGFFDSVILARPYVTLLDLQNAPRNFNTQSIDGSELNRATLAALGARLVMTPRRRPELPNAGTAGDVNLYGVPNPVPRAMFFPAGAAVELPPERMHERIRGRQFAPHLRVMVPPGVGGTGAPATIPASSQPAASQPATQPATRPAASGTAKYERPGSDEIVVAVQGGEAGFVRVLETFDEGWRAEVDGRRVEPFAADDTFLGVAVPAGSSRVRFTYHTPGAGAGAVASLASLVLLGGFLAVVAGRRVREPGPLPA